jgi:Putative beta-barrel porin 2
MNKQLRVAGLMTVSAVGLTLSQRAVADAFDSSTKPWSVSLALQGFYNDNIFTRPSGLEKVKSWGAEVSPGLKYDYVADATTLSFGYTYAGLYFEARPASKWDNYHFLNGSVSHKFNERYTLELSDNFAITKEPSEFLSGVVARTKSDNISNHGSVGLTSSVSEKVSVVVSYKNNLYQYDDAAYKAPLNRIEHLPSVDFRYQLAEKTFGVLGYQFGDTVYDGNPLNLSGAAAGFKSDIRDNLAHYIYVGADHSFTPELSVSARVGAEFVEYDNYSKYIAGVSNPSSTSPYADVSLKYKLVDGSVALGVRHQRNPTDLLSPDASGNLTLDQESTLVYLNFSHKIVGRLKGGLNGSYQNASFKGGTINGQKEDFYSVGASLDYAFTAYLSASASYSYDKVSDASGSGLTGRDYSRNRLFFGVNLKY